MFPLGVSLELEVYCSDKGRPLVEIQLEVATAKSLEQVLICVVAEPVELLFRKLRYLVERNNDAASEFHQQGEVDSAVDFFETRV